VPGVDYVDSSSNAGSSTVTAWLELNVNSSEALAELTSRLNQIRYELPDEALDPSVEVLRTDQANALFYLDVDAGAMSRAELTDYMARNVTPILASIDGVQRIGFEGGRDPAMRVWLDPARMASVGIGADTVITALRDNNVLAAIGRWDSLALAGVEVYEGVLKEEADIRRFLQRAVACLKDLSARGQLARRLAQGPAVLTGAGSAWYDVVAEEFGQADIGAALDVVLRPGCYLTHDHVQYRRHLQCIGERLNLRETLRPALEVICIVQSCPEPGLAILTMGKRDVSYDLDLPVPQWHAKLGDSQTQPVPAHWTITGLNDQHAYLHFEAQAPAHEQPLFGGVVGSGICRLNVIDGGQVRSSRGPIHGEGCGLVVSFGLGWIELGCDRDTGRWQVQAQFNRGGGLELGDRGARNC
jgi:D-serine deaminase-like pyridoxal phosphate-dependent protein